MTVTIELKPETEAILQKRASAQGCDVARYVQSLVEKEARSPRSFDEILAPLRREVEASGITERELDDLFTEARRKVFQAKQRRRKK